MNLNTQLTHDSHTHSGKKFPLSIIAHNISSPLNIGSLFRLCDALGVNKLYLCGDSPVPPNSKINKTSRSTEKYVSHDYHRDAKELVLSLKATGVYIISLEITSSSLSIDSSFFAEKLKDKGSVSLILGAEKEGVSDELLSLSDLTVHIPMFGNNSSMNVASAASIACYEIIKNLQI